MAPQKVIAPCTWQAGPIARRAATHVVQRGCHGVRRPRSLVFTLWRASGPRSTSNEIVISIHRDDINVGMAGAPKRCFSLNIAARIEARGPTLPHRWTTLLSFAGERRTRSSDRSPGGLQSRLHRLAIATRCPLLHLGAH